MKRKSKSGWRINRSGAYKVKGKTKSRRKTYKSKSAALRAHKKRMR